MSYTTGSKICRFKVALVINSSAINAGGGGIIHNFIGFKFQILLTYSLPVACPLPSEE